MEEKTKEGFLEKNIELFRTLSFIIGGALILLIGLFYVLYSDLELINTAGWLFFGIIAAFGATFCVFFSDNVKHKKILFYALKGLGVFCSLIFILAIVLYTTKVSGDSAKIKAIIVAKNNKIKTADVLNHIKLVKVLSLIIAPLSIVMQGINIVINAVFGINE